MKLPGSLLHAAAALALAAASAGAGARLDGASQSRAQTPREPLLVFAASDLGPAFTQLVPQFERKAGTPVTLVLGSTGNLTQQIRNGAPADVFFAANESYIRQLAAESLTIQQTRSTYARGRLAIVSLEASRLELGGLNDLAKPEVRRIAIANPVHAPYGMAARQALEAADLWQALQPRLVYGENVQQAAQFVRSGSADAGIVARSVADTPDVTWTLVHTRLHAPLDQVAVVLARTQQPAESRAFIEFITGTQGRAVMRHFGFLLPGESF